MILNIKNIILIFLFYLLSLHFSYSQRQNDTIRSIFPGNHVYAEFGGNALTIYSINFERLLCSTDRNFFSARAGFGYQEYQNYYSFPSELLLSHHLSKHNFIDFGVGFTYFNKNIDELYNIFYRIGYRYQEPREGLSFKIALTPYTPIIKHKNKKNINLLIGVAIGYSFNNITGTCKKCRE